MRKDLSKSISGLLVPVVVFIVFLTLKLTNVIAWSWWKVTSPLWIVAGMMILITLVCAAVFIYRLNRTKQ